jgi:NAD(P)-dependent dehydrogenase (short-subunit alcohol dehydrogenase family)
MSGICQDRVAVVTGAGRGLGREYALELARQGALVVVNDLGVSLDGSQKDKTPADEVAEEIRSFGGEALVNADDISDWAGAAAVVRAAIDGFGGLDILVNNAGIVRDRMIANMSIDEWDAVIRVHLRGSFAPLRHAASYWRAEAKDGRPRDGRVINTTSGAGLFGNVGQANYSAAKGGIASLTLVAAKELAKYGVTANAVAPSAITRMTASSGDWGDKLAGQDADRVAPLVAWLASPQAADVTGRIFHVRGAVTTVVDGYVKSVRLEREQRWDPAELAVAMKELLAGARPPADLDGEPSSAWLQS